MTKGGARDDQRGAARRNDQESAQNDGRASGVRMCANCASYLRDSILACARIAQGFPRHWRSSPTAGS